ncbi:MAG TPA: hypothetical protein VMZ28_31525 [Kofleriaceae bacterium]|nr:hypothetical protein [Kofleriaceae bacterium]
MKILILLCAVVGIVGMFLPFLAEGDMKLWDARTEQAGKAYMPIAGFALAFIMGIVATVKGGLARWHAIVALLGFGLAILVKEVREGLLGYNVAEGIKLDTGLGGKLLFVAAAAGALFSLIGLIKPER